MKFLTTKRRNKMKCMDDVKTVLGISRDVFIVLLICCVASPAAANTVKKVPSGYKACVKDGGKCTIKGAWTGYYGARTTFVKISGTGPFTCSADGGVGGGTEALCAFRC
jgi:hypothetical protein